MQNLHQTRALITGAGHGLGRAIALQFAAAGAEVIVNDRDPQLAAETARLIWAADGQAVSLPFDVTDVDAVRDARRQVLAERGPIDILVNNAGVVYGGTFLDVPLERHRKTFEVNIGGAVVLTHVFLPDLVSRPRAQVVNIASASGLIALPYAATYAASKWGVIGFSESLREELRLAGNPHVHVTTVCPGYISTGMFAGVRLPKFSRHLTPERVARLTVQAVLRDRDEVLTPWFVKITPLARALLPRALFRRLCDWLDVHQGMAPWRGHTPVAPAGPPCTRAAETPVMRDSASGVFQTNA